MTTPAPAASTATADKTVRILEWLFFASGFAALLYQVIWQRALYAMYGVNVESVTMVVTVFMIGLGAGSLLGGIVSKAERFREKTALLFALAEGTIGLYGLFSLSLFHALGAVTLLSSATVIALTSFAMLLVPTTMMGATLPLLVAHFTRTNKRVGDSLGSLYHMNTLGAAAGALLGGMALLVWLGQSGSLRVAASINFVAAAFAYWVHRRGVPK